LMFKGRTIANKDQGFEVFNRVIERTQTISKVEIEAKLLGKKLIAQLSPDKKKEIK